MGSFIRSLADLRFKSPFFNSSANSSGSATVSRPAGSLFYASFSSSKHANWADGSLKGVAVGGADVASGKLNLKGGTLKYVEFSGIGNANVSTVGCIRCTFIPNYSGSPAATRFAFSIGRASPTLGQVDMVRLYHDPTGPLACSIDNDAGGHIVSNVFPNWSPVAGTEYILELNWDLINGETRLFINGVQFGSTVTATGTRGYSPLRTLRVGTDQTATATADHEIKDLIVFNSVQHTSNHTASFSYPSTDSTNVGPGIIQPDNFEMWYEPRFTEQANGTALATLPDASGFSKTLTMGTAANQPSIATGVLNSQAVSRHAADYMFNTTSPALGSNDYDFYILLKCLNSSTALMFNFGDHSASNAISLYQAGTMTLYQSATGNLMAMSAPNLGSSAFKLIRMKRTSGTYRIFVNGVATTPASVSSAVSITAAGFTYGAWSDGSFAFSGDIAFTAGWRGNLTAAEDTALRAYILATYGV